MRSAEPTPTSHDPRRAHTRGRRVGVFEQVVDRGDLPAHDAQAGWQERRGTHPISLIRRATPQPGAEGQGGLGSAMTDRPAPGTPLVFRWRKWDGAPHWEHDCVYLGSDVHGDWVGQRDGWRSARPGVDTVSDGDNVTLIPPSGDYAATLNATHPRIAIYIDVAWDLRRDAAADPAGIPSPTGIDMDLDVVRARDGRGIWIDDRDEWDEHRVQYGYPWTSSSASSASPSSSRSRSVPSGRRTTRRRRRTGSPARGAASSLRAAALPRRRRCRRERA
jgi:hypothetical protein